MRSRYRELPYPKAKTLDPDLKPTLCDDPDAQRALLAWLVAAAVDAVSEPEDVPEVRAATTERVRDDSGEIGEFARRIVRGDGVLTVPQVWQGWCEHNGETVEAKEPGGIGKRRLSNALCDHVPDFRKPQQISVEGLNVRGWRGWRLLTAEEAEDKSLEIQVVTDLLNAVRKWDENQIKQAIPLLEKLAEGQIVEDGDDHVLIAAPAYAHMLNERNRSVAFEHAYRRVSPTRDAAWPISIGVEVVIMLAEKYLVQADSKLRGDATADSLAFEASRQMTAAMGTASEESNPDVVELITSELDRIIKTLCQGHNDAQIG